MEQSKILTADLLDLIFDNRNKEYGAYQLRRSYENRITKSLVATGALVAVILGSIVLIKPDSIDHQQEPDDMVKLIAIVDKQPEEKKMEVPVQKKAATSAPVQTEKITPIKIVPDDIKVDPIPTTTDQVNAAVGTKPADGGEYTGQVQADPGPDNAPQGVPTPLPPAEPLRTVDVVASFDGDWRKFLLKHLRPEVPVDNNAPAGRYTVLVEFIVDVDGAVSGVQALTAHGFGIEQEAERVIKKSKHWIPSLVNGKPVKAYRRQQITFEVSGE